MSRNRKRKKKKVLPAISAGIMAGAILFGCFGPITKWTPFWMITTRPEIRYVSKNLFLGNRHRLLESPWLSSVITPSLIAGDMVYGMKALCRQAKAGDRVYYEVYSEEEMKEDPEKKAVGLYCLQGNTGEKNRMFFFSQEGGFLLSAHLQNRFR